MRLREKLAIIFFVFILIPMFLLWALWFGTATESVKSVLRQELNDRSREISDQITLSLQNDQEELRGLTRQPALKTYARALSQNSQALPDNNLRIDLSAFQLAHQQKWSALLGLSRQGSPVFKIEGFPAENGVVRPYLRVSGFSGEDVISSPEVLTTASSDSAFISEIEQDSDGPHVKIIAVLRDDANNPQGALMVKVRADALLSEAAGPRAKSQPGQRVYSPPEAIILSPQGIVLHSADPSKQRKPYNEAYREFEQAFTSLQQEKNKDLDRQPWLVSHRLREASPQLSIFVIKNYSNATDNLDFSSYVLLFLTFLLVLVAILMLYTLISSFTDSIRNVTKGAKAIATGNLGYQIKVKAKDETRVLAEAFNRMASRLREMIRKEGEQKQFESFARLSSVLTHDLKNQILSLSLLVSNMERKFDREGFKEDAMRTLSDSVNNLQNLVSKLSDPRTPTKRVRDRSNISHLVERVIQRTAGQAANRFKISAQLAPDLYATVDGKAIERVIENLVINAIEAMPGGGALKIATRSDNGNAVISVADTGKGMTEDFMRERLFHPFATTKKKGIGLGLYSCRDIIEQHGGRIDVASKVDVGTEFKIILPITAEEPKTGGLKSAIA